MPHTCARAAGDVEAAELARARKELAVAAVRLLPAVQRALCVAPPEAAALRNTLDGPPPTALRLAPAGAQPGPAQGSAGPETLNALRNQALALTAGLPGFDASPRPALIAAWGPAGPGLPPLLGSVLPAPHTAGPAAPGAAGGVGMGRGDRGAEGEPGSAAAAAPLLLGGQAGGAQRGVQWGAWRAARVRSKQMSCAKPVAGIVRESCGRASP